MQNLLQSKPTLCHTIKAEIIILALEVSLLYPSHFPQGNQSFDLSSYISFTRF